MLQTRLVLQQLEAAARLELGQQWLLLLLQLLGLLCNAYLLHCRRELSDPSSAPMISRRLWPLAHLEELVLR